MDLKSKIRSIPDFPKKGIVFRDITPVVGDGQAFKQVIDMMAKQYEGAKIDSILGAEARGFIFGAALAYKLGLGFIPVRKPGKLPYKTTKASYDLEYGSNEVEIHVDAIKKGDSILIVDDLAATGGTAKAQARLVEGMGARVAGFCFFIELEFLKPREMLNGYDVFSLVQYDSE